MIGRVKKACLVVAAVAMMLMPGRAYAGLPRDVLNYFSQNNILFYDPTGGCDTAAVSPVLGKNVTWIGDSYSEGAELTAASGNLITKKLPGVDIGNFNEQGAGGDQPADSYLKGSKFVESGTSDNPSGLTLLKGIVDKGELRPYLVFALGNNGGITSAQIDEVLGLVGSKTKVVFVNLYMTSADPAIQAYIKSSNEVLAQAAKEHDNVRVADWAAVAKDEYYSGDSSGVHPFAGYQEWVDTIYEALISFKSGVDGTTVADNQNYAGDAVWTEEQLQAIKANRSVYEKAEQQYGIPWQAMATMHSLETNLLRVNPENGQGIYQLYTYTAGGANGNAFLPAGPVSDEEFERQTLIAAAEMRQIIEARGLRVDSDEGIKALLFQYNGKAQQYIDKALAMGFTQAEANIGEGSPYVMNRYDARRDPNSNEMDPVWPGRFVADGVYDAGSTQYDFGGFVKYIALAGSSGSGDICVSGATGGNMDLNASAIELAWSEAEGAKSFSEPKPEYTAAMKSTGIWAEADRNNDGIWDDAPRRMGMSCDMFVGTVVRYSGVDPGFPYSLGAQKDYLANSDMWEELYITDSSQYQGGDIRIEYDGGHIAMVVEVNGELKIASGSAFERFGDIGGFYMNGNLTYRLKQ